MVANKENEIVIDVRLNMERFTKNLQALKKNTRSISGTLSKIPFQAWALSALFFGMAIKRVFESIAKSAVATFSEVVHSGDMMVTSFDILGGVFKFLAFTVGDALNSVFEPLVPIIWDIVMAVAQWVGDNQKLVGWIIIVGIVLGTLLMVAGTLILGIMGLVQAFGVFLVAILAIPAGIWLIVGAIALLLIVVAGNFKRVTELMSELWQAVLSLMSGDMDGFIKHMGNVGIILIQIFANTFFFIRKTIIDIMITAGELAGIGLFKGIEYGVNKAIEAINVLIMALNKIPGVRIRYIPDLSLGNAISAAKSLAQKAREANQLAFGENQAKVGELDRFKSVDTAKQSTINVETMNVYDSKDVIEMFEEANRLLPQG